ncbi:MAG: transporter component [Oscillospiraceae bacterium]|jgi:uncharacterized membrane protein|nr:transporter component [Oscillospiraceae bacterium]
MFKKISIYIVLLLVIPLVIATGTMLFEGRRFVFISLVIAVLSCVPFFLSFEKKQGNTKKMVVIAVMIALSVAGRFLFYPIPFFKPVTAIVVITALYMGAEAGFLTGSLSAIISDIYFGQGPWTPFQMFIWGFLGFFAGLLAQKLIKSRFWLCAYGVLAGVLFSLFMDIWTVLWKDGGFSTGAYAQVMISAVPVIIIYAVSNVIFLFILAKPIGEKLLRVKIKYGL